MLPGRTIVVRNPDRHTEYALYTGVMNDQYVRPESDFRSTFSILFVWAVFFLFTTLVGGISMLTAGISDGPAAVSVRGTRIWDFILMYLFPALITFLILRGKIRRRSDAPSWLNTTTWALVLCNPAMWWGVWMMYTAPY